MLSDAVIADLLIPLGLMAWLWFDRDQRKVDWLLRAGVCGAVVMQRFMVGTWSMLGYVLRYVLVAVFVIVARAAYWRVRPRPFWHESAGGWLLTGISLAIAAVLIFFDLSILWGYRYEGEPVSLAFPLKGGIYYIADGGSHPLLNGHLMSDSTTYAVDIEALNGWGRHSNGFAASEVDDYVIYGATVYSPCEGQVVEVMNVIPDSPVNKLFMASRAMNRVVLQCGDIRILLGHLLKGSVVVEVGDRVEVGHPLAKVGNSGKSWRPHLHIQTDGRRSKPVPILFDGAFLARNALVVQP